MPRMPAILANVVDRAWSNEATVVAIDQPHDKLKRVRFCMPALMDKPRRPGVEIEMRVSQTELRHYTPAVFAADGVHMDVQFYLHGMGPGSAWAERLRLRDTVGIMGPGGFFGLARGGPHVLVGDETCAGLFESLMAGRTDVRGVLEAEVALVPHLQAIHPQLAVVPRTVRGHAARDWLLNNAPTASERLYLCGHAQSIQLQKRAILKARRPGMQPFRAGRLKTKVYWADNKAGL